MSAREREREERELAWVPCALASGYTSYGSEGRYSGKFRVMQQRGLSSLHVVILSLSQRLISSPLLYEEKPSLSFFPSRFRARPSWIFLSFFVSGDKPMVRSRRSRRPTAYTPTRQLLGTTRHIVSNSCLPSHYRLTLYFSLNFSSAPQRIGASCIRKVRDANWTQRHSYVYRKARFPECPRMYIPSEEITCKRIIMHMIPRQQWANLLHFFHFFYRR